MAYLPSLNSYSKQFVSRWHFATCFLFIELFPLVMRIFSQLLRSVDYFISRFAPNGYPANFNLWGEHGEANWLLASNRAGGRGDQADREQWSEYLLQKRNFGTCISRSSPRQKAPFLYFSFYCLAKLIINQKEKGRIDSKVFKGFKE